MNTAIVGTGYVGLASGTCFVEMGNKVACVNVDQAETDRLLDDKIPIYEPGLEDLIKYNVAYGRLHFTADITKILGDVEVVFSAAGAPPDEDGSAGLKYVLAVACELGQNINEYTILATKSTIPVGTAKRVKTVIQEELDKCGVNIPSGVTSNPGFLGRGATIKDLMNPDRVIVGVGSKQVEEVITKLYHPFLIQNFRVIFMDILSAEMTEYVANVMLATRIGFMNDMTDLCERMGTNVDNVRKGIGTDAHIGRKFLYAGCDYDGSYFPKGVKTLIHSGIDNGYHMEVIEAAERVNENQRTIVYNKFLTLMEDVEGKAIAAFGLAFKLEVDNMHEAPALVVIEKLLKAGASVQVFDPITMSGCKRGIGNVVTYCENMYDIASGTDVLALMTEWRQFRMPTWNVVKRCTKGNVIVDGRNIYGHQEPEGLGSIYTRISKK